jgi:hypothetical protein
LKEIVIKINDKMRNYGNNSDKRIEDFKDNHKVEIYAKICENQNNQNEKGSMSIKN